MKVKILKSKDQLMWYAKLIGTKWLVLRETTIEYIVRDAQGYLNIIMKEDGKLEQ